MSSHEQHAPAAAGADPAAAADESNDAIADARRTLWIVCGAILAWALIVFFFIL